MQIRIVTGTGAGRTALSAYDAALAAANVHDYNLVTVSSVVPAHATVERVGTAPDLGPVGNRLTVVEARATVGPDTAAPACAALGWTRAADGRGLFYEASGPDERAVREAVEVGLADGVALRDWEPTTRGIETVRAAPGAADAVAPAATPEDAYTVAVALAVYGDSTPIA
jgi:arginine decarboxylase